MQYEHINTVGNVFQKHFDRLTSSNSFKSKMFVMRPTQINRANMMSVGVCLSLQLHPAFKVQSVNITP